MNKPKVSVIIPVYNTEEYVEQAARSVMQQTLREIEIIVINDGSTDRSPEIIEQLMAEDPRIKLHSQPNKGLSEARNAGIDRAAGEFIYFMDSDDLLEEDTLENCYTLCQADLLDFVFFDAVSFGSEQARESWYDYRRAKHFNGSVYSGTELLTQMLERDCYRASACLSFIRLSFLKALKLRFYPRIVHEDELFTAQLYVNAHRVRGIERTFFHRRLREGSIMDARFSERNLEGYSTVLRELKRLLPTYDAQSRRAITQLMRIFLCNILLQSWHFGFGRRCRIAAMALREYPAQIGWKLLGMMFFKKPLKKLSGR